MQKSVLWNQSGAGILTAGLLSSFLICVLSCSASRDADIADARGRHESFTVYTALTPLYGSHIPKDYLKTFADITGFDLNVVPMYQVDELLGTYVKSWYAMREGPNRTTEYKDILANLDELIHDDKEVWDFNRVRHKAQPDLIVSTIDDSYVLDKAADGYFLPATEVLALAPEFRLSHGDRFWNANFAVDEFGIPLYSFQHDDPPAYWVIDADLRRSLFPDPISSFDGLMQLIETAAASVPGDRPVVATGGIPLGAIALHMKYAYLPVYMRVRSNKRMLLLRVITTSRTLGFGNDTDFDRSKVTGGTLAYDILPPDRNTDFFTNLADSPLVRDPVTGEVINLISESPPEYWSTVERICDLYATGRVDSKREYVAAFPGLITGSIKALFVPSDSGLSFLKELMNRFPTNFDTRFEIVPVSGTPVADLQAYFRAWVPKSTTKLREIARWFDTMAKPEVFEPLRYGIAKDSWKTEPDYGLSPGKAGRLVEDVPPGWLFEVLSRAGLPELVPGIVPGTVRSAFRLDDANDDSFVKLEYRYVELSNIKGLSEAWEHLATNYAKLLLGSADFASTVDYLRTYGERALESVKAYIEDTSPE